MVHCSFVCMETRRLVRTDRGRTAQDGHLDSHTAPELWLLFMLVTAGDVLKIQSI